MSRRLIEYQNPELAALPLAQGYPALPVRWNTMRHFWPLALETGRTVGRGLLRRAGLRSRRDPSTSYPLSLVAPLPEIRDLLRPESMISRDLYRPERLRDFLGAGDLAAAPEPECYGRILTVELAARALRSARATEPGG